MRSARLGAPLVGGLALCVLGCAEDGEADHVSGSRLKALGWRAPDGETTFGGWYDALLETECDFVVAADGTATCLPMPTIAPWVPALAFLDDRCTKPATTIAPTSGTKPLTLVVAPPADGCWEKPRLFRAGKPTRAGTLYGRADGTCQPLDGGGVVDAAASREVTPLEEITDRAARARVKVGPAVQGIARRWFEGADGARGPLGWWDDARRAPCVFVGQRWDGTELPLVEADGAWRCVPLRDPRYWAFTTGPTVLGVEPGDSAFASGDPACNALAVEWREEPACPSNNGVVWERNPESGAELRSRPTAPCPSALTVHAVAERQDQIYSWRACLGGRSNEPAAQPAPGREVRALAAIPPKSLPAGRFVVAPKGGRLRRRWIETAAGRAPAGLWDSKLGAPCTPGKNAQGVSVCLPRGGGVVQDAKFTDETCGTKRATVPERASCGGPTLVVSPTQDQAGHERFRVYRADKVPGGTPHARHPSELLCRPEPRGAFDREIWGVVGEEISDLVPLERIGARRATDGTR